MSTPLARGYTRLGLDKISNPPILPIPRVRAGNNVPHSMHKTRRIWRPHTLKFNVPVTIVGGALNRRLEAGSQLEQNPSANVRFHDLHPQFNKVKMTHQHLKQMLKAGGLEGMLLSRPSKHFTHVGKVLRHEMFEELHRIRRSMEFTSESSSSASAAAVNPAIASESADAIPAPQKKAKKAKVLRIGDGKQKA